VIGLGGDAGRQDRLRHELYCGKVSAIDVKTRTKNPTDIIVGSAPLGLTVAPCRR
jgi:hypothetical protein